VEWQFSFANWNSLLPTHTTHTPSHIHTPSHTHTIISHHHKITPSHHHTTAPEGKYNGVREVFRQLVSSGSCLTSLPTCSYANKVQSINMNIFFPPFLWPWWCPPSSFPLHISPSLLLTSGADRRPHSSVQRHDTYHAESFSCQCSKSSCEHSMTYRIAGKFGRN